MNAPCIYLVSWRPGTTHTGVCTCWESWYRLRAFVLWYGELGSSCSWTGSLTRTLTTRPILNPSNSTTSVCFSTPRHLVHNNPKLISTYITPNTFYIADGQAVNLSLPRLSTPGGTLHDWMTILMLRKSWLHSHQKIGRDDLDSLGSHGWRQS